MQPYAFTTKSLFVGHMDYRYLRWQVIDTPGILDRPLEERNTIEMQVDPLPGLLHVKCAGHSMQVPIFLRISMWSSALAGFHEANPPATAMTTPICLQTDCRASQHPCITAIPWSCAIISSMLTHNGSYVQSTYDRFLSPLAA